VGLRTIRVLTVLVEVRPAVGLVITPVAPLALAVKDITCVMVVEQLRVVAEVVEPSASSRPMEELVVVAVPWHRTFTVSKGFTSTAPGVEALFWIIMPVRILLRGTAVASILLMVWAEAVAASRVNPAARRRDLLNMVLLSSLSRVGLVWLCGNMISKGKPVRQGQ